MTISELTISGYYLIFHIQQISIYKIINWFDLASLVSLLKDTGLTQKRNPESESRIERVRVATGISTNCCFNF